MLRHNTPIQNYLSRYGLFVKREDMACAPPGPPFSKTRGVFAHIQKRPERLIGVLDTAHSQAGHAVAYACKLLGKECINFYPVYKSEFKDDGSHELRNPQIRSSDLGAEVCAFPAGRSCILYHRARNYIKERGGYLMPNSLKLPESVTETAKEVPDGGPWDYILIPASSGTIAAGVIQGCEGRWKPTFLIHMGYSRPAEAVEKYLQEASGVNDFECRIIDEGYAYRDKARPGETPPWACNEFYDLKSFRWWLANRERFPGRTLLWNVG